MYPYPYLCLYLFFSYLTSFFHYCITLCLLYRCLAYLDVFAISLSLVSAFFKLSLPSLCRFSCFSSSHPSFPSLCFLCLCLAYLHVSAIYIFLMTSFFLIPIFTSLRPLSFLLSYLFHSFAFSISVLPIYIPLVIHFFISFLFLSHAPLLHHFVFSILSLPIFTSQPSSFPLWLLFHSYSPFSLSLFSSPFPFPNLIYLSSSPAPFEYLSLIFFFTPPHLLLLLLTCA